ncbi:MAG: hypothetical protein HPM95_00430 [Alphaproteobacteria bacterium]|nr:hypothetical protein [Alphaproteobacteria bacterium]
MDLPIDTGLALDSVIVFDYPTHREFDLSSTQLPTRATSCGRSSSTAPTPTTAYGHGRRKTPCRTERLFDGSLLSFVSDTHGAYTAIRDPQGAVPLMVLTSARTGWDRTWIEDLLPRIAVRGLDASATAPDSIPAGGHAP